MNLLETSEVRSPAEYEGPAVALACFACSGYLFLFGPATVEWLNAWWAAWLVYLGIPLALTFTLLHGSHIHREMSEAGRDMFLLLVSVAIFVGMVFFVVGVVVAASVFTGFARIGP